MDLWLVAIVAIIGMVAVGTVVALHRRSQGPPHRARAVLAVRLVVIVVVTALIAVVRVEVGPGAAAATGIVGVAVAIALLIRTGFAGPVRHTR